MVQVSWPLCLCSSLLSDQGPDPPHEDYEAQLQLQRDKQAAAVFVVLL